MPFSRARSVRLQAERHSVRRQAGRRGAADAGHYVRVKAASVLLTALFTLSCESQPAAEIQIRLQPSTISSRPAPIEITGLTSGELSSLRDASFAEAEWEALLRVSTGAPVEGLPPVKGRYAIADEALTFAPMFPFDPGRSYHVAFDPRKLPNPRAAPLVTAVLTLPAVGAAPTNVVALHPSAPQVPENLLRIYIEFSAPMGSSSAADFVKLIDLTTGKDEIVENAFLPVEADFWNRDHTRYTLFLDPGRVKQDILPNRVSGRPLRAGHRYALEIAAGWPDANRQPLSATYRHEFAAAAPIDSAILLSDWKIAAPRSGTRDPLLVSFRRSLDHAVTMRALAIERRGQPVAGSGHISHQDTRWAFVPEVPWERGEHNLSAMSFLEDPQGNQINRPFEEAVDAPTPEHQPEAFRLNFVIAQ